MQPPEVVQLSASLRAAYQQAQEALEAELSSIEANPAKYRRVSRLRELQRSVEAMTDTLDQQAADWLLKDFPTIYAMGAQSPDFTWTQADRFAITQLAQDTFDELLAATKHVDDATKRLIRKLSKSQSLLKLTTGQTATQAGKQLRRTLERSGISSVTYKNGAKHGIGGYADTVIRTVTAKSYNLSTINFGDRTGTKFYEIFDGTGDEVCARANGTIVDSAWIRENPLGHPRCQRSAAPRPELRTRKEADEAKSLRTPEQMADQRQFEAARVEVQKRRAQSRRRVEARKARRLAT